MGTQGGTLVIRGQNFDNDTSLLTVITNGVNCANVAVVIPSQVITCQAPGGVGMGLPVSVSAYNDTVYSSYNYLSPIIIAVVGAPTSGVCVRFKVRFCFKVCARFKTQNRVRFKFIFCLFVVTNAHQCSIGVSDDSIEVDD